MLIQIIQPGENPRSIRQPFSLRLGGFLFGLCFGLSISLFLGCSTTAQDRRSLVWPAKQGEVQALLACRDSLKTVRLAFTDSLDAQGHAIEIALNPKEQAEILSVIRKSEAAEGHAMTPPPWPVAFVLSGVGCGDWAGILVGNDRLRFNAENPHSSSIMSADAVTPVATEVGMPDSTGIIWRLLESKLGETQVKQYRMDF